jgi:hypothetical protein
MAGAGGALVLRLTYVTNLKVKQYTYSYIYIIAGSTVFKITVWFAHDHGFKRNLSKILLDFHGHRIVKIVHARHLR